MSAPKRLGLSPDQADRMTVSLMIGDALTLINGALARRKAKLHLDYVGDTVVVSLSTPTAMREPILTTTRGQRIANWWMPVEATLNGLAFELLFGLEQLGAKLFLVIQKDKGGARYAKLQLFFNDSRLVAATLMETKRNTSNSDTEFTL